MPLWIGIDPGKKGYISSFDGKKLRSAWPIPYLGNEVDAKQVWKMLRALKRSGAAHAVLEHQQSFGIEGRNSIFTHAFGYGALKALLTASGIPFEVCDPETWKRAMGIPKPSVKGLALPKIPKDADKKTRVRLEKERKEIQRKRKAAKTSIEKRRKELALRVAQGLSPKTDFRANSKCRVPHDGKFESFLIAVYSYRTTTRD